MLRIVNNLHLPSEGMHLLAEDAMFGGISLATLVWRNPATTMPRRHHMPVACAYRDRKLNSTFNCRVRDLPHRDRRHGNSFTTA
jgi:hypothetical protein